MSLVRSLQSRLPSLPPSSSEGKVSKNHLTGGGTDSPSRLSLEDSDGQCSAGFLPPFLKRKNSSSRVDEDFSQTSLKERQSSPGESSPPVVLSLFLPVAVAVVLPEICLVSLRLLLPPAGTTSQDKKGRE